MLTGILCSIALAQPVDTEEVEIATRGPGVGIGLDGGWAGSHAVSGFKIDAPLVGQHFGLRVRGTFAYTDHPDTTGFSPTNGAGVELWARSPVLFGFLRGYGGGGPHVAIDHTHELAVGGGGHFGVEALVLRRLSLTVEAGRHWGNGALAATKGASLMGGLVVYVGKSQSKT